METTFTVAEFYDMTQYTHQHIRIVFTGTDLVRNHLHQPPLLGVQLDGIGRGYPDGLKGDEIPISAQLVSLADVYDALTSERCYKKAFSHEKAMQMILNGECGAFNPLLLQCLTDIQAD